MDTYGWESAGAVGTRWSGERYFIHFLKAAGVFFRRLRPFFFLRQRLFLRRSSVADLGIDLDERANELLEVAKLGNFALGLFLSGGSWKGLGYGLAAIGLTATAAGIGDGTATQIAQSGDLFNEIGSSALQIWKQNRA